MKLTLKNVKELKRTTDNPLTKRVCSYVIDEWGNYLDKKHIFTEKVLTLTDEEASRVREAVEANGVTLTISLFQKYLGSRIAVKEVVESGELGKINYVRFRNCHSGSINNWLPTHFYNAKECGGGAMIDLGAHGMYLIHWLLGMPVSASSAFTLACENPAANAKNTDGVEDNAVTVMSFEGGAIAINETGFCSNCAPVVFEVHVECAGTAAYDHRKARANKLRNINCFQVPLARIS